MKKVPKEALLYTQDHDDMNIHPTHNQSPGPSSGFPKWWQRLLARWGKARLHKAAAGNVGDDLLGPECLPYISIFPS